MFRQGDVLLIPVAAVPDGATAVKGPVILAHGEVTGHVHRVKHGARMFSIPSTSERFLKVNRSAKVLHEEHGTIDLGPGNYRVVIQKEYSPQAIRNVAD